MMDLFSAVKLLHILSATVLVGTGVGTAFFMYATHLRGEVRAIASVSRTVVLADWIFTTPTVFLQPLTGAWLVHLAGYTWSETWIVASLGLYVLAAGCWLPVVRLQIRMRDLATRGAENEPLPADYHRCMRLWFVLGWPALIAMTAILALMVFRPGFS